MPLRAVRDWLQSEDEPAIRYLTLRDLEHRPESDSELREARARIPSGGWVRSILAERDAAGWWARPQTLYAPKYVSTNWRMIVLADLGATREVPEVQRSAELWMEGFPLKGGGVGGNSKGTGHHCVVGNMTRALIELGYRDDPRVRVSLDWLVATAHHLGGWSCWGSGRNLDSWEGLSAIAAYPRAKRTKGMQEVAERAVEFFLERELHRQGAEYRPWFRFHYPVHYYYDLLVGLDLVTSLGHTDDPRLRFARTHLERRRRRDGRWNLDAVHPDVEGPIAQYFRTHPRDRPVPWSLEKAGAPSKMVTLRALRVLDRFEGTAG
jgi:hypothetical protein